MLRGVKSPQTYMHAHTHTQNHTQKYSKFYGLLLQPSYTVLTALKVATVRRSGHRKSSCDE